MSENMEIQSHKGTYRVLFEKDAFKRLDKCDPAGKHFIVDKRVADLYASKLRSVLESGSVLIIEATELNKTLDRFTAYIEHLVARNVRRNHTLVAIGGGIIQDITCFLSSTLLRGIPWIFYPTTLLAQADSCIGSKSSINVGITKNILGTFTPPEEICIDTRVLKTLEDVELRSGIGEMLKVHGIDGPLSFKRIAGDYHRLKIDDCLMEKYIADSLLIKKRLIEIDEFDRGPRNIMNYGHSFGHALEAATDFAVPHGIAVTIGLDMAGYFGWRAGVTTREIYRERKPILQENYKGYEKVEFPMERFFAAIGKDKKNEDNMLKLILPDKKGHVFGDFYKNNDDFKKICTDYFLKEL